MPHGILHGLLIGDGILKNLLIYVVFPVLNQDLADVERFEAALERFRGELRGLLPPGTTFVRRACIQNSKSLTGVEMRLLMRVATLDTDVDKRRIKSQIIHLSRLASDDASHASVPPDVETHEQPGPLSLPAAETTYIRNLFFEVEALMYYVVKVKGFLL